MSNFRQSGHRGTTIKLDETITRPPAGTPVDLTLAGTKLVMTGKLRKADTTPVFVKDYAVAPAVGTFGGITVAAGGVAHILIGPADTAALTQTSYVLCDIVLTEASGDVTPVASGVVKVIAGVGT